MTKKQILRERRLGKCQNCLKEIEIRFMIAVSQGYYCSPNCAVLALIKRKKSLQTEIENFIEKFQDNIFLRDECVQR